MLMALIAAVLSVMPTVARAANNPAITVSNFSLVSSNANGEEDPSDTSIKVDDILKLSFAWDASSANAKSGDSFQITLPVELSNRESIAAPMTVTHNNTNHTIGSCVMDVKTITCTFNPELDTIVAQGFSGLRGTGSAIVVATQATEQDVVVVDANGQQTSVAVPGGRIAPNEGFPYKPEWLTKWAYPLTASATQVDWELTFGSDQVKEALEKNGNTIVVDGQTRTTITFVDELEPGQTYSTDMTKWSLSIGAAQGRDYIHGQVTNAAGVDNDTTFGDFDISVSIEGAKATIAVTGPFAPATNYQIYYSSIPTSPGNTVQPGVEYKNRAHVEGANLETSYSVYYTKSFTIDVEMAPGFGGLKITKLLIGPEADKVPADTTFSVTIDYLLPGGATVDTYAGWTAPGTVNADRTGGTVPFTITVGGVNTYDGTFPAGTVLTLSEDTASASTTPVGVIWGTPSFTIDDAVTNTFTVKDQVPTPVTLRNSANSTPPPTTGDFTVTKVLAGDGDFTGSAYTFTYTCSDGAEGTLTVLAGQVSPPSKAITAGATCTVTEDAASAARPGYTLTAPEAQTVTIRAGETASVSATNRYTADLGIFSVKKEVTGDYELVLGDDVDVNYVCDDADRTSGTITVPMNGRAVAGPELPVGTTCTITEDAASANRAGFALATTYSATALTVAKDPVPVATVTNNYQRLVGGFTVSKTVQGDAASLAPTEFTFDYVCLNEAGAQTVSGELTVAAGRSQSVSDVPVGTCTVTERDAGVAGATLSVTGETGGQTTDGASVTFAMTEDASIAVSMVNTYTPVPEPSPSPTPTGDEPTPTPSSPGDEPTVTPSSEGDEPSATPTPKTKRPKSTLARTGASIAVPVIIAAALVGGGVLLRRRRA